MKAEPVWHDGTDSALAGDGWQVTSDRIGKKGETSNIQHPTLNSDKSRAGIECQKRTARQAALPHPLCALCGSIRVNS